LINAPHLPAIYARDQPMSWTLNLSQSFEIASLFYNAPTDKDVRAMGVQDRAHVPRGYYTYRR